MEPITLIALASAAGFVFKKMTGNEGGRKKNKLAEIVPRRSKTVAGQLAGNRDAIDIGEIEELPEYRFVRKLVDVGFPIVFVTGGAGTGKTTFINWLVHHYAGDVLLAAPTAIAAANIEGKTLHSLFQLPLQWITQSGIKEAPYRQDIKKAKLLVIDEISMVNANLLDGVSGFLRKNRGVDKPFGGLPLVMVGDLFQLPPVVKSALMPFFDRTYGGKTKFFVARSLTETSITYYGLELTRTFRQSDKLFIDTLADIREGRNLEEALHVINSQCEITSSPARGAVWLAPRRADVERVNRAMLQKIHSRLFSYDGYLEGDFTASEENLPSPIRLDLKVGAQVMFTQDDPMKKWRNGTVGVVTALGKKHIEVKITRNDTVVTVNRAVWTNFNYRWNRGTGKIEKQQVGSYRQYPLELAWAVTIHKSQGKTIEKVHLDLGRGIFAFGQTYVALSRCRELRGLTLSRALTVNDIKVDIDSQVFNDHLHDLMEKLPPERMLRALARSRRRSSSVAEKKVDEDI